MASFARWLDTLVEEKNLDTEHVFCVQGPMWGDNLIPLAVVLQAMKDTGAEEQAKIKQILVHADSHNRDMIEVFAGFAGALAK